MYTGILGIPSVRDYTYKEGRIRGYKGAGGRK